MNLFFSLILKKSKNLLFGEMFKIFHQRVPLPPLLPVFEIMTGYFFYRYHFFKQNKLLYLITGKNTKKIFLNIFVIYFLKYFSVSKLEISFDIFLFKSFTSQFNPFLYNIIIYTSIKYCFYFFVFYFGFNIFISCWNIVYGIIYHHFA